VEKLADFESLQFLELSQLHLDSEFFNAMLKASNLERVLMTACKFRLEHYREFAVVRPRLINFLPRSFLGVQGRRDTGTANSYTCEIELVVADSAAAKAGIQVGDVITAVNGERITSFEELRMFISQHDAGEKMQVSIDRLGEQLDVQVILGTN
jgi:membrane-associated protease RseP (regulator of RpoE activity)